MHPFIEKILGVDKEKEVIRKGLLDGSIIVDYKCKNNIKAIYNINFGGKKIKIHEKFHTYMGERQSSDYLLNNETDLKELGQEGKYLMKIINEFDKERINQNKEERNKIIKEKKEEINEILSFSDPIIEQKLDINTNIYNINFGGKLFEIHKKIDANDIFVFNYLLNDETDLKDLGKEGKYLMKIINEFDKNKLNQEK